MAIGEARATLEDLLRIEGKAELIGGGIVPFMPTGHDAGLIATAIVVDLFGFARRVGRGKAFSDGVGYAVPELASGRQTFCPDASYYTGPRPSQPRKFINGPPDFAVEVRSDGDYGKRAEAQIAAKRLDYFARDVGALGRGP